MTTTQRTYLVLACMLTLAGGSQAYAQDTAATPTPVTVAPATTATPTPLLPVQDMQDAQAAPAPLPVPAQMEPAAGSTLPFTRDGANQPVLQTISPDGVAIAPDAMQAPAETTGEAAGHEGGEHSKGLPQFDTTTFPKQIFWLFVTFAFMYVFFSKKTLPAIGGAIKTREDKIKGDVAAAETIKVEIEAMRTAYEAAIASAQSDAQKLINDVQTDIKRDTEAQDAAFKAHASSEAEALQGRIDASRTRILGDMNALAADLTVDIASRVAGVSTDSSKARSVIDGLDSQRAKAA